MGTILIDKDAFDVAADLLSSEMFYYEANQLVFRAFKTLSAKHQPIDLMTVINELTNSGDIETVGGVHSVVKLTNSVVSSSNLESHCKIVQEKYIRRQLIQAGMQITNSGYDESEETFLQLERSEKLMLEVGQAVVSGQSSTISDVVQQSLKKIAYWNTLDSTVTGVTSGFGELDFTTRGWQPGDLIIIAARPSMGKTALSLNLARNAAVSGSPVAIWSLEMKAVSQGLRMLSAESRISLTSLLTGKLDQDEMRDLNGPAEKLSTYPIYFDDSNMLTLGRIRSQARRLVKKKGVKLIIVDYLQLMTGEDKRSGSREQEISQLSRGLKNLAQELDIPIIALSQLSRDVEKRTVKEPMLSDLRESGAIEQDADVVGFLYGPLDSEIMQNPELRKRRYLKIAKQRNGVLQTIDLDFDKDIQLFSTTRPAGLPPGNFRPIEQGDLPF